MSEPPNAPKPREVPTSCTTAWMRPFESLKSPISPSARWPPTRSARLLILNAVAGCTGLLQLSAAKVRVTAKRRRIGLPDDRDHRIDGIVADSDRRLLA